MLLFVVVVVVVVVVASLVDATYIFGRKPRNMPVASAVRECRVLALVSLVVGVCVFIYPAAAAACPCRCRVASCVGPG